MSGVAQEPRGFSFPFKIGSLGRVEMKEGPAKLRQNVRHIMMVGSGERIMLREYGAGIYRLYQRPNREDLANLARGQVERAVTRWEPRVMLAQTSAVAQESDLAIRVIFVIPGEERPSAVTLPLTDLGGGP